MKYTIHELLGVSTDELKKVIWMNARPKNRGKDYAYFPGDIPIMLVAHIDTVRKEGKKEKPVVLIEKHGILYNKNGILGADDRAGVYAICCILSRMPEGQKPHVLFTDGEESGGWGAGEAARDMKTPPVNLMIELDRKGVNEYVTYVDIHAAVAKYVESFGFRPEDGSYSDIYDLSEAWLIPGVNLSVGYYGQHTSSESLHLDVLELTINRVCRMLENPIEKLHKCKKPSGRYWHYADKYDYAAPGKSYKDGNRWKGAGAVVGKTYPAVKGRVTSITQCGECDYCGDVLPNEDLEIVDMHGIHMHVCPICLTYIHDAGGM